MNLLRKVNATSCVATVREGDVDVFEDLGFTVTYLGEGRDDGELYLCTKSVHGDGSELPAGPAPKPKEKPKEEVAKAQETVQHRYRANPPIYNISAEQRARAQRIINNHLGSLI